MGRIGGMVVFVPGTAPGDVIRVRITNKKSKFMEGAVVEILTPSRARRRPPCPVADRCGGCSWQHVEYAEQVVQKQGIVESSLRGLRKLAEFTLRPLLAAPNEFHYRNRVQLQVRDGKYGFFAKGTNALVETRECWISEPALNDKLRTLTAADAAGESRLELALLESGEVSAVAGRRSAEVALFAQVNRAQNEVLKEQVLAAVHGRPDWIFDLYAGSGNLTAPLAGQYAPVRVVAVELSRAAVERAKTGADWRIGDVGKVLAQIELRKGAGLIVLDPPRTGCEGDVIEQLLRLRAKQIVYVSCNPATFARDAERLIRSGQYSIEWVQGLDMFPQTEHVELIASFTAR